MRNHKHCRAQEDIPFSSALLVAGSRAYPAKDGPCNARAPDRTQWDHEPHIPAGRTFMVKLESFGEGLDLQALANGPIMRPEALYLPAGRISEQQYQVRMRDDFRRAGIEAGARPDA